MWKAEAPGWAWLLRHEARLLWRGLGGMRSRGMLVLAAVVAGIFHAAAWALMRGFDAEAVLRTAPLPIVTLSAVALTLALGSAFGLAVNTLYDRGDLDLLLGSPVALANVYAMRGVAVALASVSTLALFVLPFANMGPVHGRWGTLLAYPVLAATGLACGAVAFAGTLWLVRWLGVRRARVAAQVAGALVGAGVILALQAESFLPREHRMQLARWARSEAGAAWLGAESPIAWPFRAAFGDATAAAVLIAGGVALFLVVIATTWRGFAAAAIEAPVASRRAAAPAGRRFRQGLARVVIAKELALIARDPTLIARSLLNVLYLVPLFIVMVRNAQPPQVVAAAVVVLCASLASNLAWITVSGEESPDLLGSAPVSLERVRWLKVASALLPPTAIALPFLFWFATSSAIAMILVAAALGCALVSSAVVQVWTAPLGGARDLRMRPKQNPLINIADTFSAVGWGLAAYFALAFSPWTLAGAALGLLAPVCAWVSARDRRGASAG